jgi:hypothetical protein
MTAPSATELRNLMFAAVVDALRQMAECNRPCSKPIGAPHSPARLDWEQQCRAYENARLILSICGKDITI